MPPDPKAGAPAVKRAPSFFSYLVKGSAARLEAPDLLRLRSEAEGGPREDGSALPPLPPQTLNKCGLAPPGRAPAACPGRSGSGAGGTGAGVTAAPPPAAAAAARGRVSRVLLPICFLCGVLNYLDRTNLNFAALQLNADLGFTPTDYGLGAGFFSLGYGVAHVPSAFMTMRYGARWWYSSITVAWGVVATCGAVIRSRAGLCLQRFFLGVTEAGAIPSALFLIAQFYPKNMLTKPYTAVTLANVLSVVIAAPLAAGLMSLDGVGGLRGWEWLFIIEGIPSVLLGFAMMALVPSHPLSAWMLSVEEREALHVTVHGGRARAEAALSPVVWGQLAGLIADACRKPLIWFFSLTGFLWVLCVFSLNSWMAIIIKNMLAGTALTGSTSSGGSSAVNTLHATLLSAIPYFCAGLAMVANAWSANRLRERTLHVALPCIFGGVVLACFEPLYRAAFVAGFVVIVIAISSAYSGQSVMFARVADLLDTEHAGVGLAIFNAVGAAGGGFAGPWIVGAFVQRRGSFVQAMVFMGMFLLAAGLLLAGYALLFEQRPRWQAARARAAAKAGAGAA
ncbi:abaQ [Scenedesmus sp. PABB004]|nr:abaQ [Scenedesmus sp. PABB004]